MKKQTIARRKEPHYRLAIAILIVFAISALFPLLLVLMNSFKTHQAIARNPLSLPTSFNFDSYVRAWTAGNFGLAFLNSLKITGTSIIVGVLCATSMGFVLATRRVKTWKALTMLFLLSTTVPLQMFLLPLYKSFVNLNLMGNQYAVGIVIAAWSLPMPVFLMRTYFLKVPKELEEAAMIDGASTFQVFTKIMMPIASPGMVTVACIIGLGAWNEYLLSSTLLQGEANFPATIRYLNLNGPLSVDYAVLMAGAVVVIAPIIIVFLLLQKQFIEGMSAGAVKG